jgi:hypothetical protein
LGNTPFQPFYVLTPLPQRIFASSNPLNSIEFTTAMAVFFMRPFNNNKEYGAK